MQISSFLNKGNLPYIVIIILIIIILLQNKGCSPDTPAKVKVDTVFVNVIVRDTIEGKIRYIRGRKDTLWINKPGFVPKSTYDSLLEQYKHLGALYFKTNIFKTRFDVENYGYITVSDSISENWLTSSVLKTNLVIPEKTITKEIRVAYRQLYFGGSITGNGLTPIDGLYGGLAFKDKKDHLYIGNIGYTGLVNYQIGAYWPFKFSK